MPYTIAAFYKFFEQSREQVHARATQIQTMGDELEIYGLILVAREGINGTITCESRENLDLFFKKAFELLKVELPTIKYSYSESGPYDRLKVKEKNEIVTLRCNLEMPVEKTETHMSPEEWNRTLKEDDDYVLIDTRNYYETDLGIFKGARDPRIEKFVDFPEYVSCSEIPKDKKVLMYCTGGIRCEKAMLEMKSQGYENVHQLEGGILAYLEKFPDQEFEGECFVFDSRVAVGQKLEPTERWALCPHCGDPGERHINCSLCGKECVVCQSCLDKEAAASTCSKNCAYHFRRNSSSEEKAA